ncbi:hypothetical protein BCR44DRAFT_84008 [Catenaria anguillulae PL171]|uniref:Uncharacterized protein n=1 Tax=Catenaria anguillulae PL171 TaxID=765915 RepID=A0A1Y2HHY6_9FUNG|nr:hypothetical protein BCR44DRAFT_84008 [Catenaria anguillulae PL171]
MPRTFQDVNDIVHSWLLGAFCAYTVWVYANRSLYGSAQLSRMTMIVSSAMVVRLLTTIRLETTDASLCHVWILVRVIFSNFSVMGLNIYFVAELFLNVVLAVKSKPSAERRKWRYSIHGFTQAFNLANGIQHATNLIPVITPAKFCALTGRRDSQPLAWMIMTSFFICLGMTIALALSKSMFSATVPEFARLFRILTVSSGLLCVWVTYAQMDLIFLTWDDWKSFNTTIMLVWMSVNSIIANNYLIGLRSRSSSAANQSSGGSGGQGTSSGSQTKKDSSRPGVNAKHTANNTGSSFA